MRPTGKSHEPFLPEVLVRGQSSVQAQTAHGDEAEAIGERIRLVWTIEKEPPSAGFLAEIGVIDVNAADGADCGPDLGCERVAGSGE